MPRNSPESLDANLVRLAARVAGTVAALVLAFDVLQDECDVRVPRPD